MGKAVFIDRDGVVNSDEGHYYIYRVEDFVFNPDIELNLAKLKQAGFKLVMVTNQGGVAKGIYTEADVQKVHAFMQKHLSGHKSLFDAIYYCPHHHEVSVCNCRKPKPGMLLQAAGDWDIDLSQSYMIGDSDRDIEAGEAAGVKKCFKVKKNTAITKAVDSILENGN